MSTDGTKVDGTFGTGIRRSPWLAEALAVEPPTEGTALRGRTTADVCIVGGGYTGLWTALELKIRRPDLDVCLVEAGVCGSGASGTNAGLLMNLWPKFPSLEALAGRTEATWLAQQSSNAVDDVIGFCRDHDIEAHIERRGWLWASSAPAQDGAWTESLNLVEGLDGAPFRVLDGDTARALGSTALRGGVLDPTSATLQPALLVRGLRRVAVERYGVRIYEHTPMRATEERGNCTHVVTSHGRVEAGAVVLAINAWMSAFAHVRRTMVMSASDNAITRPLPPELLAGAGDPGLGVSDSTRMLNYWRTTRDARVVFGKGGVGLGFRQHGARSMFGPVRRDAIIRRSSTASSQRWPGRTSPRPGGRRSSTPSRRCPTSSSCPVVAGCGSAPATPVMVWAPAAWEVGSSPVWCSARTTNGRTAPSRNRRAAGCRPNRSGSWAARW